MKQNLDTRRILIYLAFTFGIAWLVALVILLTGGLANSPQVGDNLTLALVLVSTVYMWAPAIAHLLTRLVTGEGWQNTYLSPRFKKGWPYWVAAWVLPAVFTALGAVLFFGVFPRFFDPSLNSLRTQFESNGQPAPIDLWTLFLIQIFGGVLLAPVINCLFSFGEEFGWRAYLLPKLIPAGARKAILWMGLIWGIWYWPLIAMGYHYGVEYWGWPWLGLIVTTWLAVVMGAFLGWVTLRGGSIWPAVIGHAAVNGISGFVLICTQGQPNLLLGPLSFGFVASIGWALIAFWVYARPPVALEVHSEEPKAQTTVS